MPYFFFSYASANAEGKADAYVSDFFKRLEFEIEQKSQPPVSGEIGFRDRDNIVTGDNIQRRLSDAVRTCKVFVPLYSPAYFTRPDCGKEWHAFEMRLKDHVKATATPNDLPPLIMPVWWVPVDMAKCGLPDSIQQVKYTYDHLGEEYNFGQKYRDEGLLQLLQLNDPYVDEFVMRFAKLMRILCSRHVLQDAVAAPLWDHLPNAFQPDASTAAKSAAQAGGPGHVEFLIAAGCAGQFAHLPTRQPCYGDRAEYWKPYHPQFAKRIGPLVQATAGSADFTSRLVDVGPGLGERLRQAKKNQNIVVLVVDPWSLDLDDLADCLREYDELDLWNCTAFVTWNEDDVETQSQKPVLLQKLTEVFENKTVPGYDSKAFRGNISSLTTFELNLAEALAHLHQRIVEQGNARRAKGDRDITLPQVKGPGGTSPQ